MLMLLLFKLGEKGNTYTQTISVLFISNVFVVLP